MSFGIFSYLFGRFMAVLRVILLHKLLETCLMSLWCAFVHGWAVWFVIHNDFALFKVTHWKNTWLAFVSYPVALQTGQSLCDLDLTTFFNSESFTNKLTSWMLDCNGHCLSQHGWSRTLPNRDLVLGRAFLMHQRFFIQSILVFCPALRVLEIYLGRWIRYSCWLIARC